MYNSKWTKKSSYIESPDWLNRKNAKINPKNIEDRCFQYAFTLSQHHKEIILSEDPILKVYNWDGLKYPDVINNYKSV